VPVSLALALVDAAAGAYLVWYSVRQERRDKPGEEEGQVGPAPGEGAG
jgi:threonine/homoserine/homoserine lactone efflux protein